MRICLRIIKFFLLVLAGMACIGTRAYAAESYGPKENVYVIGHCFLGGPTEGYPIDENGEWNENFHTPATFTVNYSGADASGYDTPSSIPTVHIGHWGHSSGRGFWESAFGMENTAEQPDIYKSDYYIDDPNDPNYGQINGGIDSDVYWALFKNCTFTNVNIEMHFPCAFYGCTFNNCSLDSRGGHDVVCYDCTFVGGHTNAYGVDGGVIYTYTSKDKSDEGGVSAIHLSKCVVRNDDNYRITRYLGNTVNSFMYAYDAKVYLYDGNTFTNLYNCDDNEISVILSDGAGYGLGGVYVRGGTYDNSARNDGVGDGIFIENKDADIYLNGGDIGYYKYAVYSIGGNITHGDETYGGETLVHDSTEINIYVNRGILNACSDSSAPKNYSSDRKTRYGIYAVSSEINTDMSLSGFSVGGIYADADSKVRMAGKNICDTPIGIRAVLSEVTISSQGVIDTDDVGINAINSIVEVGDEASVSAGSFGVLSEMSRISLDGGTIRNATVGIDATNSVVNMTGGLVETNGSAESIGIRNVESDITVSGGCISSAVIGIYQDGILKLSGGCSLPYGEESVSVYLCRDRHIDILSELYSDISGIKVDTAVDDRDLGRLIARNYCSDSILSSAAAEKFCLAFSDTNAAHGTGIHKGEPVKAVIRAGIGLPDGLPADEILISGIFYTEYKENSNVSSISVSAPIEIEEFYYKEPYTYTTGADNMPIPYYGGVDIGKSYIFKGWALDPNELADERMYRENVTLTFDDDFEFYGIWSYSFDLFVCGNGQTEGDDYYISDISFETILPVGNTDATGSLNDYFKKVIEEDGYTIKNKWMGWSFANDSGSKYVDISGDRPAVYTLKSLFGYEDFSDVLKMLDDNKAIADEGRLSVSLYAVWNEYPRIVGYDIYITEAEAASIGEDRIKEKAKATDKEDGIIDSEKIKIRDFDPAGFKYVGDRGGVSVILTVQDSCGNESACVVMVYILKDTPITSREGGEEAAYVRFIDRENYNKESPDEGGTVRYSVWRLCSDFKDTLLDAFDNLEAETFEEKYVFDASIMSEMSEYTANQKDKWFLEYFWSDVYNRFCAPNRE